MLQGIRLIAFDLDGTLVHSLPDLAAAIDQALLVNNCPGLTYEQASHWVGNGADVLVARGLSQSMTVDPAIDPALQAQVRADFDRAYAASAHSRTACFAGVVETLTLLKTLGFKLAIVTNKPSQFVPEVLEKMKIAHLFEQVLGGDFLPQKKPDPAPLNWLLAHYQLQPAQMLMVGDSKNDILAAKAAGCYSVGLTYGYNHGISIAESQPDWVFDDFSALLDVFKVAESG